MASVTLKNEKIYPLRVKMDFLNLHSHKTTRSHYFLELKIKLAFYYKFSLASKYDHIVAIIVAGAQLFSVLQRERCSARISLSSVAKYLAPNWHCTVPGRQISWSCVTSPAS